MKERLFIFAVLYLFPFDWQPPQRFCHSPSKANTCFFPSTILRKISHAAPTPVLLSNGLDVNFVISKSLKKSWHWKLSSLRQCDLRRPNFHANLCTRKLTISEHCMRVKSFMHRLRSSFPQCLLLPFKAMVTMMRLLGALPDTNRPTLWILNKSSPAPLVHIETSCFKQLFLLSTGHSFYFFISILFFKEINAIYYMQNTSNIQLDTIFTIFCKTFLFRSKRKGSEGILAKLERFRRKKCSFIHANWVFSWSCWVGTRRKLKRDCSKPSKWLIPKLCPTTHQ